MIGPAIALRVEYAADQLISCAGHTTGTIASAYGYCFVGPRTSAADGQSLLFALQAGLRGAAADLGITVGLTATGKIQIVNVSASAYTFTMPDYANLGFSSATVVLPAVGSGGQVTAPNRPRYIWFPEQNVNETGPQIFDPAYSVGIPRSEGASSFAPDGSASYVSNGTQWDAEYIFRGVENYWKFQARAGHVNEDLAGFWNVGLRLGYKVLWWRDVADIIGNPAPSAGASSPFKCIEYNVADELRAAPLFAATWKSTTHYDVRFPLRLTEAGETPPT